MNIDFSAEPMFSWYVVLLAFAGIVMLGMAAIGGGQSVWVRALDTVFGIGFVGYAVYLGFIFTGGTYVIFFKAFFVPVFLFIGFVKSLANRRGQAQTYAPGRQAFQQQPYGQPAPGEAYGQPAPGQPYGQTPGQPYGQAAGQAFSPAPEQATGQAFGQTPGRLPGQATGQAPGQLPPPQ
ncbi:hypothetical protein J4573_42535 [Actinomadura barringtoniae]|uniref:Uncharacterized protein n=1 Tax=Actinomadura barringtoniae TaxID=1427535 RepID=A0A939PRJ6_9ACTN|nr:hypothetical protein [Actinomadura barringtoniae]MBO2453829.1 hypothetical protein [Actinomadura barringtoniae]